MLPRLPVTAVGEATSLAERKRRAGQRLLLALPGPRVDADLRALLRVFTPAGFALDPARAEEPGELREGCAELCARSPAAAPALLLARASSGAACPGATAWPPLACLARASDPGLTRAVGQAWRREVAALGFHLHETPAVDAAVLAAFLAPADGGAEACLAAFLGTPDEAGRIAPREDDLPALLAEGLAPLRAAFAAGVPALLVGREVWAAFDEELPACLCPALLRDRLRGAEGYRGLLIGEVPRAPEEQHLALGVEATVDLLLAEGTPPAQVAVFEALVRLQEERPGLDLLLDDAAARLLAVRERLLIGRRAPALDAVGTPAHRDLAALARARGG